MVPFAGWSMPVKYSSDVAEHLAVRSAAGLFDISHMAQIEVVGPDAATFLDHALAGRMSTLAPLQSRYTMILAPSGGIVDDLIVTNTHLPGEGTLPTGGSAAGDASPTQFLVVANAANRAAVISALTEQLVRCTDPADRYDVELRDTGRALIAVQGPNARAILGELVEGGRLTLDSVSGVDLDTLKYYRTAPGTFAARPSAAAGDTTHDDAATVGHDGATPVTLSRTGYTGEDGFEISIAPEAAGDLWDALVEAGAGHGLVLAGLASRDTLRLEAGMPLFGQELSLETLPVQAGLGRVAVTAKDDFVGRDAVLAGPAPDAPVLVGLALTGRRAARTGYPVVLPGSSTAGDASAAVVVVGTVTSGVLSPTLGHPIAMAFVRPDLAEVGTTLAVDVRGTHLPAVVVDLPFYRRTKES